MKTMIGNVLGLVLAFVALMLIVGGVITIEPTPARCLIVALLVASLFSFSEGFINSLK